MDGPIGLDPRTPVIVGVGQHSERIEDPGYEALSHVDLAARAARAAYVDTGLDPDAIAQAVDVVAATRQFEISTPLSAVPFGRSSNVPRSIAQRVGSDPVRAVLEVGGGQSPQKLVTEFCGEIAAGRAEMVLVAGAEAMSTVRHLRGEGQPDWSEDPVGTLEDRGYGLRGMVAMRSLHHGLHEIAGAYALAENARRASRGETRAEYAAGIGALFEPFTRVAAHNPHAVAPEVISAAELTTVDERNRMVVAPLSRLLMSRDLVNQGAAVLLTSVGRAQELGIDPARWVFLHGHADLREQDLWVRPDLGSAPSQADAVRAALAMAGTTLDAVEHLDLYSCFPVAVAQLADDLGLAADDRRGLTVTGGLPFFGGPGNNYSMHAIAEVVARTRAEPGSLGLVSANGGSFSKVSVGVYATSPAPWRSGDHRSLQAVVDARPTVELDDHPLDGWATVETFTVRHGRSGLTPIVVARTGTGRRFVATNAPGDTQLADWLEHEEQPVGQRVFVRNDGATNHVTLTHEQMDRLLPAPRAGWRDTYDGLDVERTSTQLHVTITGSLDEAAAHVELAEVLDAYEADRDLRVAVLHVVDLAGAPASLPRSGWAGLTTRAVTKPVVVALSGDARGGGFEALLAATLVVVADTSTLALDQVTHGRLAVDGGLVRLPRLVPPRIATELVVTGRPVGAAEALALGLVNRVVPVEEVHTVAGGLATSIATVDPFAVRLSLEVMAQAAAEPDTLAASRRPRQAYDDVIIGE